MPSKVSHRVALLTTVLPLHGRVGRQGGVVSPPWRPTGWASHGAGLSCSVHSRLGRCGKRSKAGHWGAAAAPGGSDGDLSHSGKRRPPHRNTRPSASRTPTARAASPLPSTMISCGRRAARRACWAAPHASADCPAVGRQPTSVHQSTHLQTPPGQTPTPPTLMSTLTWPNPQPGPHIDVGPTWPTLHPATTFTLAPTRPYPRPTPTLPGPTPFTTHPTPTFTLALYST